MSTEKPSDKQQPPEDRKPSAEASVDASAKKERASLSKEVEHGPLGSFADILSSIGLKGDKPSAAKEQKDVRNALLHLPSLSGDPILSAFSMIIAAMGRVMGKIDVDKLREVVDATASGKDKKKLEKEIDDMQEADLDYDVKTSGGNIAISTDEGFRTEYTKVSKGQRFHEVRDPYKAVESKLEEENADDKDAREAKLDMELSEEGMNVTKLTKAKQVRIAELIKQMDETSDPDNRETLRREKIELERDVAYFGVMRSKRKVVADTLTQYVKPAIKALIKSSQPEKQMRVGKVGERLEGKPQHHLGDGKKEIFPWLQREGDNMLTAKDGKVWKKTPNNGVEVTDENGKVWKREEGGTVYYRYRTAEEVADQQKKSDQIKADVDALEPALRNARFDVKDNLAIVLAGVDGEALAKLKDREYASVWEYHGHEYRGVSDMTGGLVNMSDFDTTRTELNIADDSIELMMPGAFETGSPGGRYGSLFLDSEKLTLRKNQADGTYTLDSRSTTFTEHGRGGQLTDNVSTSLYGPKKKGRRAS